MSELINRDKWERELAKLLAGEFTRFRNVLLELFPELVEFAAGIAPEIWATHTANLTGILAPTLGAIVAEELTLQEEENNFEIFGVDWTQANERAAAWAEGYSYELVTELKNTSEWFINGEVDKIRKLTEALQISISDYFRDPLSKQELAKRLSAATGFGMGRAKRIAVTETTRASVESRLEVKRQLGASGINTIDYWLTRNDPNIVCELCMPRHGKRIGIDISNEYPPLHVNCYCDFRMEPQYSWSE